MSLFAMVTFLVIGVQSAIPETDPIWSDFQCFSAKEAQQYRQQLGIGSDQLAIWSKLNVISNTWSLQSYVSSILFQDILKMNISTVHWNYDYLALLSIIESPESLRDRLEMGYILHWDIQMGFYGPFVADVLTYQSGMYGQEAARTSQTRWSMRRDVMAEIQAEVGSDSSNNLYLDLWRPFLDPSVVAAMNSSDEVIILPDENGQFACGPFQGCWFGDGVWYPPICFGNTANCMVLLQFLPEHDPLGINRDLIEQNGLPIVIKYLGSERSSYGQTNFKRFYNERWRVIFHLRSIESQSNADLDWKAIALPLDEGINVNANPKIFKVLSVELQGKSWLFAGLLGAMDLEMKHLDEIQRLLIEKGEIETNSLRMQAACDWLRMEDNFETWCSWLRMDRRIIPDCSVVDDEELIFIDNVSHSEIWHNFSIINRNLSHFIDAWGVMYAKENCIKQEDGENAALFLFGYILSIFAGVMIVSSMVLTLIWRKERIIVASSVPMMSVIYIGALIASSCIFFLKCDDLTHCVLRRYVEQIGIVLIFGALDAKTWRLLKIQKSIVLLKRIKITDRDLFLRVMAVTIFAAAYLTVLMIAFPMEIVTKMTDGVWTTRCEWDDIAWFAYGVLIFIEVSAVLMIGKMAFSLRATNEVYNESKHLGMILYGAVILVVGIMILGAVMDDGANQIMAQTILETALVILVIGLLMVPKFIPIVNGTVYCPDSLKFDQISFSTSELTKEDVRKMRRYLRKFGYRIEKADAQQLRENDLSLTGATRSSLSPIKSMRHFETSATPILESVGESAGPEPAAT